MTSTLRHAQTASGASDRSHLLRFSKLAAALAASSLFATGLAHALPSESEPNDSAPGNAGVIGDPFEGSVRNAPDALYDPVDFVTFQPLSPGATYTLSLDSLYFASIIFELFGDLATTSFDTVTVGGLSHANYSPISGIGALTVRISTNSCPLGGPSECGSEGYRVQLNKTADGSAPEPASAVLLAAGLAAAFVARRRKRP